MAYGEVNATVPRIKEPKVYNRFSTLVRLKMIRYSVSFSAIFKTLKVPIMTAADNRLKYFSLFYTENKT